MRVLLIEDNDDHAALFESMIEDVLEIDKYGGRLNFKRANCLTDGIAILKEFPAELLLLDLGLPESRGFETFEKVKPYAEKIPIIVLTANQDFELSAEAVKAGAQDYLVKGETSTEVLRRSIRYAEERWTQLIELERRNKDLDEFSRVASHDLKSPLRMISQSCEILGNDIDTVLSPMSREILEGIQATCNNASRMVEGLLKFSKFGRKALREERFQLSEVVEESTLMLGALVKETDGQINCEQSFEVVADRVLFVELFQNLIGNGLKYVRDKIPSVKIQAEQREHDILIRVSDNGIGIENEYLEKIFDPFYRLHTDEEYEGSGVGLALCLRIVEAHNGQIWAESALGKGTTFSFTLSRS